MASMHQEQLLQQIRQLIEPVLRGRQMELVDLSCHFGSGRTIIRCLVDTARGITLDELSSANRVIGALLDEHDLIPERYLLEVSSPGLDRPLKNTADFERVIGRRIRVVTSVPVDAKQEHSGELLGANDEAIVLKLDSGDKLQIVLSHIAHAVQEIGLGGAG
jgi:ribosome maturation factor RimP